MTENIDWNAVRIEDSFTYKDVAHLLGDAMRSKRPRGKRAWIKNLAALDEIWESIHNGDISIAEVKLNKIQQKYNVGVMLQNLVRDIAERPTRPTIADAKWLLQEKKRKSQITVIQAEMAISAPIPETELSGAINPDMMIRQLKESRDWLNEHGFLCEVKLSQPIQI